MITATIEVVQVEGQVQFELQGSSSLISVTPPAQINLTPTAADTDYAITFAPRHPVSSVDDAATTSIHPSHPEPGVSYESGLDLDHLGRVVAHCSYPSSSSNDDITLHFDLLYTTGDLLVDTSLIALTAHDPTFVFKPPS